MKKFFLFATLLFTGLLCQASPYYRSGNSAFTGQIGFKQTAVTFGASYENRLDVLGIGGYFLYSSEKQNPNVNNQVTSFGVMAPAHLLDDSRLDIYLAPAFGIHMLKGLGGVEDVTTFGPAWKIGFLFKFTPSVRVGLEQTEIINWFTDKYAASYSYTNAAFAVSF